MIVHVFVHLHNIDLRITDNSQMRKKKTAEIIFTYWLQSL